MVVVLKALPLQLFRAVTMETDGRHSPFLYRLHIDPSRLSERKFFINNQPFLTMNLIVRSKN
jgi:hypothetical protein